MASEKDKTNQEKKQIKNEEKKENVKKETKTDKTEKEVKEKKEKNEEKSNKEEKNKKNASEKVTQTKKQDNSKSDSTKKMTKDEFTENILKKRKTQMKILIITTIVIVALLFFSIIFAVLNMNKTTFIRGVYVQNVELSGLTQEEAKNKLEDNFIKRLSNPINIVYKDETLATITPEEIEVEFDLKNSLSEAYKIGRSTSILKNNYKILLTAILKENIDLKYTYNEEKLKQIIEDLELTIPELVKNPTYYIEEAELIIVPGTDGIIVEKENFKNAIIDRMTNSDLSSEENKSINVPTSDKKAESIDVEKIHQEIYCEPKDAYFIEEPFELHLDEDGIDFAITIEEAKNIVSTEAEEYKIPLKITKAKVTINDIDSSAFRYQISTFTTNYDPGYTSRVNNLRLAAGKINGKVLGPGEEFSFNGVVGKRTIEAGYTDAKIFANGQVVDGTGGGICQVSTTLYNAVLLANLEITDRRNHSYTTSYIKAGRDATVVYGSIDFKFKNNRKYPIKLESSVSGGVIRFSVYGIQEENEYEVKIIPVVTETIPKTTKYIDDPSLVEGSEVVQQVGSSGCKVTTYKETYLNGSLVSKDVLSNDVYKVMQRIVKRGTKKASVPVVSQPLEETPPPVTETPTPTPEPQEPVQTPQVQEPVQETPPTPEVENTTN